MTKILSLNAAMEAARAGNAAFRAVADEVGSVSARINSVASALQDELSAKIAELEKVGQNLVANIRGSRLADLALNMIDIIDRNLYERSCDVRWWATDSAVVNCAAQHNSDAQKAAARELASSRLSVILDSYTVYLDLWIASKAGAVLANGRPRLYSVHGANVAEEEWFQKALRTRSGEEFVACDIGKVKELGAAPVAIYAAAVREDGKVDGKIIGALGIFFDWKKQSQLVVESVHLADDERRDTSCLIVNASHKIIASCGNSEDNGIFPLETGGKSIGSYVDRNGNLIGFALTPGYETYRGLGWYGVLEQRKHAVGSAKRP